MTQFAWRCFLQTKCSPTRTLPAVWQKLLRSGALQSVTHNPITTDTCLCQGQGTAGQGPGEAQDQLFLLAGWSRGILHLYSWVCCSFLVIGTEDYRPQQLSEKENSGGQVIAVPASPSPLSQHKQVSLSLPLSPAPCSSTQVSTSPGEPPLLLQNPGEISSLPFRQSALPRDMPAWGSLLPPRCPLATTCCRQLPI